MTLVEFLGNIGGVGIDLEAAKTLQRVLTKQGLKFKVGTKVTEAHRNGSSITVSTETLKNNKKEAVREVGAFSTN